MDIITRFQTVKDEQYALFSKKIIPSSLQFIGVRSPIFKRIVKDILIQNYVYEDYHEYQYSPYFEVQLLYGILLLRDKHLSKEEKLAHLIPFLKTVDNWAIIDSISGIPLLDDVDEILKFVDTYQKDAAPFLRRYCYILVLAHLKEFHDPQVIFSRILDDDHYYVQMGQAWLLSMTYLRYKEATFSYLKHCSLNKVTLHKTIQKIIDSYRVTDEEKNEVRTLRR